MHIDEKMLARIMFKSKLAFGDGQAYEDLFSQVMGHSRPSFVQIKPQGKIGDRKNDGYVKDDGHYFQVYAPEDPRNSESKAVTKLKKDFAGLRKHWQSVHPIRSFSFAFNDKYSGSYPTIEADLKALRDAHDLHLCECFLAKHLEDEFFGLPDDVIFAIIGKPPSPSNITNIDFGILKEVIDFILAIPVTFATQSKLVAPDFSDKIAFNGLSTLVGDLLRCGSYQCGSIDNYFRLNSSFAKQHLRDTINSLYLKATAEVPTTANPDNPADLVFFRILNGIAPNGNKASVDAAILIMAYFFETCDIFKDPNGGH